MNFKTHLSNEPSQSTLFIKLAESKPPSVKLNSAWLIYNLRGKNWFTLKGSEIITQLVSCGFFLLPFIFILSVLFLTKDMLSSFLHSIYYNFFFYIRKLIIMDKDNFNLIIYSVDVYIFLSSHLKTIPRKK